MQNVRMPLSSLETGWKATSFLPDPTLTLPQVFAQRVRSTPRAPAFYGVKVIGKDLVERAFSYRRLDRMVRHAASELHAIGVRPEDRVILCLSRADRFFAYLMGTLVLGAVPVPLPALLEHQLPRSFSERIQSVSENCAPSAVVVDSMKGWSEATEGVELRAAVINAKATPFEREAPYVEGLDFERSFDEIAFIQYTSGSTGDPKGVVIDHYNLVANFRAIAEGASFGPDDCSFSWLPLYHDMGLVGGFLLGVYMGTRTYVMATRHFVARPDAWLRGMSRYRATYTVAPNFAYNLAARRLPDSTLEGLDLSSLRLAFNGAEPIDRKTMQEFIERFARYGFRRNGMYPVYGMAECTLAALFPPPGRLPHYDVIDRGALTAEKRAKPASENALNAVSHVSLGHPLPGMSVRIVSLDGDDELPDRQLGEVLVSGPSVTRGYFGRATQIEELRTGDIGYRADDEFYIVGRRKDLIIVSGRNMAPIDVEQVAGRVEGVAEGSVAAFGVEGSDGTEELVIVAALNPRSWRGLEEVRDEIRSSVAQHFQVPVKDVCIVSPGSIPKTSSGKIRRLQCKQDYEAGRLAVVASVLSQAEIKVRYIQRRVLGAVATRRSESEFPPVSRESLFPPESKD